MADSYIHFTYARNLALHQEYSYNLGAKEGIGSTSLLWVLLLAGCQLLGIPPEVSSIFLGAVCLMISGILVYDLSWKALADFPPHRRTLLAGCAGLLTVLPGSMVWLALSGMEAALFLCLALLALKFYDTKNWYWMGLVLGALVLTRIEGLILAGSIGLIEVIRQRKISRDLFLAGITTLMIVLPWFIYLQYREGFLATASYQGRVVMVAESNARIAQNQILEWLISINPVVYLVSWAAFLFLYASGAGGLPGPTWEGQGSLLGTKLQFPYLGWVVVFLFCFPFVIKGAGFLWRQRGRVGWTQPGREAVLAAVVWMGIHNLAYAVFLSQIGAAGRYAPMNHILFWGLLLLGAGAIRSKPVRTTMISLCGILLVFSQVYWQQVYQANIKFNNEVKIAAAEYIDRELPPLSSVGATDLGPIRYFSQQPVIDLIGHVNKEVGPFWEAGGSPADYLLHQEICYLMLYNTSGGEGIDFAQELGYRSDERFELVSEARFEMDLDTWRFGSEPLRNYLPVVEVYRIDWQTAGICEDISDME